ncbi:MAG TPA: ABC transporter ATP-binding protein [Longimicrobiales bacterium]
MSDTGPMVRGREAEATSPTVSTASTAPAVLEARGLTKVYGGSRGGASHTALQDFDLRVERGEFLGIMGPSGSGKTTLLNLLSTIDSPTSGSVRIGGEDPAGMDAERLALFRRRRLGFVFQDFNLLDTLTLRENVLLPLVLDRVPVPEMNARLARVAETLGIASVLDRMPFEVSGGQQQRAAIARAIVHDPDVVLADELTGNLDSKAANDVMQALRALNEEQGVTVVMVTHDPFAASFCRRVVFIRDGRPFSELRRGGSRQAFFQQLLDALSAMGGFAS